MLKVKYISKEYWLVITSGILSGFIVFMGQVFANLGLSLYEISVLPLLFVFIILLPFVFIKKYRPQISNIWIWLLYGFASAIVVLGQFAGVIFGLSVAIVVLLLYTQPLWTIIFSVLFLKEKLTRNNIIACLIVLIGLVILVNPFSVTEVINWKGIIASLVAGIGLSGWLVIGSYLSKANQEPITTKFADNFFALLFVIVLYPIIALFTKDTTLINFSFNWPITIWLYIFLFSLFAMVINHIIYLYGVIKVKTIDAGIIMLLEPVSAAILSVLFLSQIITFNIFIGGLLILLANYLVLVKPINSVN